MLLQRLNRTDPERVFVVAMNSYSTASITAGQWVAWDIVTDKDGVSVTKPAGANRSTVAGVSNATIAHNDYGLIQCWGYRSDAMCLGGSGSLTSKLTAGQPMKFATSGFNAQAFARNSAALKSAHGKRAVGIVIEPLNTAALATQFGTAGQYECMITCL
jgi:hypothetical protein